MENYFYKFENALLPFANEYAPEGTEPKAVVHQWIHALAYKYTPFAATRGADAIKIKEVLENSQLSSISDYLKKILPDTPVKVKNKQNFTFIDLFAGIGGMRIGFQNAGGMCVFSSEFEKNAQNTYYENHGEYPFGDITKINPGDIPDHDVLLAGFPCQPFSHAGLKKGIDDTRGTLFHNIANILAEKKPKVALLENVKGLISHDGGYTLQVVLKTLIGMGYACNIDSKIILQGSAKEIQAEAKKMVLKSIDFGVPQNRQRIYIVLWRSEMANYFEYPKPFGKPTRVGMILELAPDVKYTISDRLWVGHQRRKLQNALDGKGFGFGIVNENSSYTNTISARYYKDGSEILIDQGKGNPRKLTPREAARLQGFPDNFQYSKSDMQAYKQFGNSVSVPVIEALAIAIKKNLI